MRSKIPALIDALRGSFRVAHHGVLVRQILAHIDFLDHQLAELDEQITTLVADYEPIIERLETIPGLARKCAIGMIAEIGVDMSVFATPAHLASWAGICPGNNASEVKPDQGEPATARSRSRRCSPRRHKPPHAPKTPIWVRGITPSEDGAALQSRRRDRHDILIAYWHIVGAETQYEDLGADWIARRHSREYQIARLAKQIEKLGAAVEITMPAA